jgi:2-phospho-L-lactate guanylyltransferase (CobY/MobA/RfbA family)
MLQATTAILLFSRSAREEARAKSFGAGQAGDQRMAEAMIRRTERTLHRSGLPVLRSDETNQRGTSFGERLGNAITDAFATGIEHLIVVGNDCPDLTTRHLRAAAQKLATGQNILGPDHRGGAWLLGLQRQDFDLDRFTALSWESDHLFEELQRLLPNVARLTQLVDLNALADLRRQWWRLKKVLSPLATLLFRADAPRALGCIWAFAPKTQANLLRGPPRLA